MNSEAARATAVHSRWSRTSLDILGRSSWTGWTKQDAGFLVGAASTILLVVMEPALWLRGWPPSFYGERAWSFLAAWLPEVSMVALPVHGWLLDRYLSLKTPGERRLPRWLLTLRFALACLPLFSFALFPAWRWLVENRSGRALPRSPRRFPPGHGGRSLAIYTSGAFAIWMAVSFVLPILWALWLAQRASPPVLLAICAPLHLLTFAALRIAAAPRQGRWSRARPWFALLPVPGPLVSFGLLIADGRTETLTWSAWARQHTPEKLPAWLALQEGLRMRWRGEPWFRQWRRPRSMERRVRDGETGLGLLSFYRCKTALLLLEGGALVAGLDAGLKRFPGLAPALAGGIRLLTFFALALGALGLILLAATALARLLRVLPAGSDLGIFARYLFLAPAAFVAGSQCGFLWIEGRRAEIGLLIAMGALALALSAWIFFLPSVSQASGIRTSAVWSFGFLALALAGIPIALDDKWNGWPGRVLATAALLSPLWSLLLFRRVERWLPRPFSWRDVLNRRESGRVRAMLAFLAVAVLAPGGGLAIPALLAVRSSLRVQFERQQRSAP